MAMVSNKFLGAVAIKLALGRHLQMLSGPLQAQISRYTEEIEAVETESGEARDYWVLTSDPPKVCPVHRLGGGCGHSRLTKPVPPRYG
jgi:endoribonuclease Dicer